jgi:hypothetical protein
MNHLCPVVIGMLGWRIASEDYVSRSSGIARPAAQPSNARIGWLTHVPQRRLDVSHGTVCYFCTRPSPRGLGG